MKLVKLLVACALLFISGISKAQEFGIIHGELFDTTEALIGGKVLVLGQVGVGSSIDIDGSFTIRKVTPGTVSLVLSSPGYTRDTLHGVVVTAGQTTEVGRLQLSMGLKSVKQVVVRGKRVTNTEAAGVREQQESKQIINVITEKQMSKSPDRDGAAVMARVPGVTLFDNRFVIVRGLPERYNTVMINDAISPSTEIDKRSFSFDILPSNMLDRMALYKTASADNPGDFAGGVIKVYTKNLPDSNYTAFAIGTGIRVNTTFKDFTRGHRGSTDFIGFSDGSRELPDDFKDLSEATRAVRAVESQRLNNNFGYKTMKALPDARINFDWSRKFKLKNEDKTLGYITSVSYSNTMQTTDVLRNRYNAYDEAVGKSPKQFEYHDKQYSNNIRLGIMHNWFYSKNARNKFTFKNTFNQLQESQTVVRTGVNFAQRPDDSLRNYSHRYQTRSIFTSQLGARHSWSKGLSVINWTAGASLVSRNLPDYIRYRSFKRAEEDVPYAIYIPSTATTFDAARFFSKLNERTLMNSLNYEHKFATHKDSTGITLNIGYYAEQKNREFAARWMSYTYPLGGNTAIRDSLIKLIAEQAFDKENIKEVNGFILSEGTNPSDKYTASNTLLAGYGGVTIPFSKFNLYTGIRVEYNRQQMHSADNNGKIDVDNTIVSPLPSANLSYNFTENSLIRGAYGKTVNRPEFRELAPFLFYDFDNDNSVGGNDSLKICNIHNVDLRYEFYPNAGETFSIGGFYKYFINPIETYVFTGEIQNLSFGNAPNAYNYGVELEIRKSFDKIFKRSTILKNIAFVFNGSLLKSEVTFEKGSGQEIRPLQGQSPYILNTGLYYSNDSLNLNVSLLYNVFGSRIVLIGDENFPNVYEMPRNILDLTIQKGLTKRLEGRIAIQDILNAKVQQIQDSDRDGKITGKDENIASFRRGQYVTAGLIYKF